MLVQSQVGHQRLQLSVLFAQLPQFPQFAYTQASITSFPAVECLGRHAHLPAHLAHLLAGFHLPQRVDDFLFAVPFAWHRFSFLCSCPENHASSKSSTFPLSHFRVLGQLAFRRATESIVLFRLSAS